MKIRLGTGSHPGSGRMWRIGCLKSTSFHYEATAASRQELPQIGAYLAAIGRDESLDEAAKHERVQGLLFPKDLSVAKADGK